MDILKELTGFLRPGLPLAGALVLGTIVLLAAKKFLEKRFEGQADKSMKLQLSMLILTFVLLVVVIIASPVSDTQKGQILSLIGIVLSAAIALSSTTFVGNAMAGLMLRVVKGFGVGDFVSVGDHFGRVSEWGLFHVEIQTEQRDLITLPNLHLVTNPVKTVRSSGTIIWAEVSLGYDVPRTRVRDALLEAARQSALEDPFVHVMQLGDFSVVYRVSGLLTEVKALLSTRSRLREAVMDHLHGAGIEIVSPNFMNTRAWPPESKFIPESLHDRSPSRPAATSAEEIVFDKADEAVSVEEMRREFETLAKKISELEAARKEAREEAAQEAIDRQIAELKEAREHLGAHLEQGAQAGDENAPLA